MQFLTPSTLVQIIVYVWQAKVIYTAYYISVHLHTSLVSNYSPTFILYWTPGLCLFLHSATLNGAAVGALICSENACNPVLRALNRAALWIYSRYGIVPNCSNDGIVSKHIPWPASWKQLLRNYCLWRLSYITMYVYASGTCTRNSYSSIYWCDSMQWKKPQNDI